MSVFDHRKWTNSVVDQSGDPVARYDIDMDNEIVYVQYFGVMNLDTVAMLRQDAMSNPRLQPHFKSLADLTKIAELGLSAQDVKELVEHPQTQTAKLALVSGPDIGRAVFSRLYAELYKLADDNPAMAVFHTEEEALAWLDEE